MRFQIMIQIILKGTVLKLFNFVYYLTCILVYNKIYMHNRLSFINEKGFGKSLRRKNSDQKSNKTI